MIEPAKQGIQLAQRFFVFNGELKQHSGIGDLRFKMLLPLNLLFEAASFLQKFLCLLLIVPEIRGGGLVLNTLQLFPAGRYIKETSRAVPRACSTLQTKILIPVLIKGLSLLLQNLPISKPLSGTREQVSASS